MSELKYRSDYHKEKKKDSEDLDKRKTEVKKDADDKTLSADTVKGLKLEGTKDLMQKVQKFAQDIEKGLEQLINKHKSEFDEKSSEAQKTEDDIKNSSEASLNDSKSIDSKFAKINDSNAKKTLDQASDQAQKDSEWLEDIKKEREKEREEHQKIVQSELKRAMGAQVKNFKFGGIF